MNNQSNGSQACEPALHSVSKAIRRSVKLGMTSITVYMLPDGTYTLASSSITKALHKHRKSLWDFLDSKSLEALSCLNFSLWEIQGIPTENSVADIKPVPLHVAMRLRRRGSERILELLEP